MTHAITVRLDDADHAVLTREAERIGVRPGALARVLIRGGLSPAPAPADEPGARQRAAVDRLIRRSKQHPPADAVALVTEARRDDAADR